MEIQELKQSELRDYVMLLKELDKEDVISFRDAELMFERLAEYPFYKVFTVPHEDMMVGTFTLLIVDNFAHGGLKFAVLENVVVHPSFQRLGIGKKMMEEALRIAGQNDCYKLMLSSNGKRTEAHAFYESLGFEQHGVSYVTELIK
ncbi:GNAT family N-acetyltransferase [Aquibacillus albus]|uniref:GNAT superfamily N-acetyltransferase n=1 Tax=Aquibacillus albus TaxID=1168171 RepID=A0ABS2N595_9BACI|nr:GNAT family N-acetyltransferase [Aquibacillus albus]MBM7573311.1 GNAT superfamily N-acetyltransferase [Aquibacillus albus]